jgi:hypothetical protein
VLLSAIGCATPETFLRIPSDFANAVGKISIRNIPKLAESGDSHVPATNPNGIRLFSMSAMRAGASAVQAIFTSLRNRTINGEFKTD